MDAGEFQVPSIGTIQVTLLIPDLVSKFTKITRHLQNANSNSVRARNVVDDDQCRLRGGFSLHVPVWTSGHVHGPLGWTWRQQADLVVRGIEVDAMV